MKKKQRDQLQEGVREVIAKLKAKVGRKMKLMVKSSWIMKTKLRKEIGEQVRLTLETFNLKLMELAKN